MSELTFSQEDTTNPGPWLERQTQENLKNWLRRVFWTRQTLPVFNTNAFEISELLKQGSPSLKIRVRRVIPELLQEWGRDEPLDVLDDLLIVAGRLRCAGADVVITLIISERLRNRPEAIPLRQRCLAVLSGFGCTDKTVHIFERYIRDINYAAICYSALYRYHLDYAASELPRMIKLFKSAAAIDELNFVLGNLADDLHSHDEAVDVLIRYVGLGDPAELVDSVDFFRNAGIFTTDMLLEIEASQRKRLSHLLLTRIAPATVPRLLEILERVGASLHSVTRNNQEIMEIKVKDRAGKREATEKIAATSKLNPATVSAIVDANEPRALAAYA